MRHVRLKWIVVGCVPAVVALAALSGLRRSCTEVTGTESVSVPLSDLVNGRASFFCYRDRAGARIRFILARDDHGAVHSVFDACAPCAQYHQGYAGGHGEVMCRYCGNHYRLSEIEKGEASCVPERLPSIQKQQRIEIKVSDLEKERGQF
jgi:uncharacterized membrane protein